MVERYAHSMPSEYLNYACKIWVRSHLIIGVLPGAESIENSSIIR